MRSSKLIGLLMLAAAVFTPVAFADDGQTVYLLVGSKEAVTLEEFADKVVVPDKGIVDVARGDSKKKLILTGKGRGSTNVKIMLRNGKTTNLDVVVSDPGVLKAAYGLVSSIPGVRAEIKGGKVIVGGEIRSPSAADRLQGAIRSYAGVIVDATVSSMPDRNSVVTTINKVLIENDISNLQAESYGRLIVLQGSPRDAMQLELALRIAKMIYPDIEDRVNKDSNGAPPLSIEVVFIEVQKKNDKTIGFNGGLGTDLRNGSAPISTDKNPVTSGFKGEVAGAAGKYGRMNWAVGPLSTFLKLIESKSVSRVLSNPKIVSRSGQQANFHSGGTFWLNPGTKGGEGGAVVSETIQVDYGIKLAVLPKIDPLGQIDTTITTSIIDIGARIADNESITKSEVTTSVTVKDGQSILLSGLVRKTNKKKVDRVPLLADIPLVGEIFKSRQATDEDTELLVLVTMSRVQPSNERIKAADKLWDQSGSDVSFSVFD